MYKYETSVFLNENANSFYLLGLYLTDGNLYKGKKTTYEATLKIIDYSLLDSIRNLVAINKPIHKVKNSNCFKFLINNKLITNWLFKYGCIPNKTKIVKFPNIPEQYYSHLIRGMIDGDGSIALYNYARIRFDSASYDLINGVSLILNKWGIDNEIFETPWITSIINGQVVKSTTQMYRIAISGLKAYKLLKILYKDANLFLDRKKIIADKIFNQYEIKGFSEGELNDFDRLPYKKWKSDDELVEIMMNNKGSLTKSAKQLEVSSWGLSSRLRKINRYDEIREIYPINRINNINKYYVNKLKLSSSRIDEIKILFDKKVPYKEIAIIYNITINYVAFLKRKYKINNL